MKKIFYILLMSISLFETSQTQAQTDAQSEINECSKCRKAIVDYFYATVSYSISYNIDYNPFININDIKRYFDSDYKQSQITYIRKCYVAGNYDKLQITSDELPPVSKSLKIYKWYKKVLTIEDLKYLLSGEEESLPLPNFFMPFFIAK